MTMIAHSREEIKNYVDTANDSILYALSAVISAYERKNDQDEFIIDEVIKVDDLQPKLREKYDRASKDSAEGRKISNEEMTLKIEKELNL